VRQMVSIVWQGFFRAQEKLIGRESLGAKKTRPLQGLVGARVPFLISLHSFTF